MWRLHNLLDRTLISLLQCWRKNVLNSQIKNGMQKKPNEIIMSTTHFITKMIEKHTDTHPICYFQRISEFRIVIFAWRTRRAHDQIYEFHLNEFTVLINYLWHSNFSLNSLSLVSFCCWFDSYSWKCSFSDNLTVYEMNDILDRWATRSQGTKHNRATYRAYVAYANIKNPKVNDIVIVLKHGIPVEWFNIFKLLLRRRRRRLLLHTTL